MGNVRLFGLLLAALVVAASWALTWGAWRYARVAASYAPLEPRSFARLTAVALGTAGAHENPSRRGPALALCLGDGIALVDAGRGVAEGLRAAEIPLAQPDTIYLTNLLPENTVGIDDLRHASWLEGRRQPLRLVGPAGTSALARGIADAQRAGLAAAAAALSREPPPPLEVVEIDDGFAEQRGELAVRAGALPGGPTPALAYRFEAGGRSAVVAGTGWAPDALTAFARGANLLVHEAGFSLTAEQARQLDLPDGMDPEQLLREAALHTSIAAVGGLADRAGVETLALMRLRPPPVWSLQVTSLVQQTFSGRVLVLSDGDAVTP